MKKKINMKKGFTMIELVFVIVIIGILSAVALPKFLETSTQAHDAVVKSFGATLNRVTAPTLWAKSIAAGKGGKIKDYCGDMTGDGADKYIQLPDELDDKGVCNYYPIEGKGSTLKVIFQDGTSTKVPYWKVIPKDEFGGLT